MTQYSTNFQLGECLDELDRKGFLEMVSYNSSNKVDYYVHALTGEFLMTTDKLTVPKAVLKAFWDAYFDNTEAKYGELWLRDDLGDEDIETILQYLSRTEYNGYRLALHLTPSYKFRENRNLEDELRNSAVDELETSCSELFRAYPYTGVSVRVRYYSDIAHVCGRDILYGEIQLYLPEKTSNFLSLLKTFGLYSIATPDCQTIQTSYELCNKRWKYNLSYFVNKITLLKFSLELFCDLEVKAPDCSLAGNIIDGLILYEHFGRDTKAAQILQLALNDNSSSSCKTAHDIFVRIVLYDIFFRNGDQRKANEMLSNIAHINFTEADTECHQNLYVDIVIPFLNSTNNTDLAEQLTRKISSTTDKLKPISVARFSDEADSTVKILGALLDLFAALKHKPPFNPDESRHLTMNERRELLWEKHHYSVSFPC